MTSDDSHSTLVTWACEESGRRCRHTGSPVSSLGGNGFLLNNGHRDPSLHCTVCSPLDVPTAKTGKSLAGLAAEHHNDRLVGIFTLVDAQSAGRLD